MAQAQTYRVSFGGNASILVRASSVDIDRTVVFRDEARAIVAVAEPRGGSKLTISGVETALLAALAGPREEDVAGSRSPASTSSRPFIRVSPPPREKHR